MATGMKTGGRVAGTPNRKTNEVAVLLESLNCNPIEGMVQIAQNPEASLELRGKMFSELAHYMFPKRKAVEYGSPDDFVRPQWTVVVAGALNADGNGEGTQDRVESDPLK